MSDPAPAKKAKAGWLNILVDYGPVVVFFLVYRHFAPRNHNDALAEVAAAVKGVSAFMLAAVIALVASRVWLGKVSRMLWLSTGLVVGFGALTILLRDPFWIQVKPTAFYLMFGGVLLFGWWQRKAYLEYLLEAAFDGLNEIGWLKLSRNWGLFFLFLAALNEVLRHFYNFANGGFGTWLDLKLWVFMPLSFLFTFTQLPMLLRHGLMAEAESDVVADPPHE